MGFDQGVGEEVQMDMTELLGGLLKGKSGKKGGVGDLLGVLLGGGRSRPAAPAARKPEPARPTHSHDDRYAHGRRHGHQAPHDVARDAYDRYGQRGGQARREPPSELENERARILIQAMVNSAKADGQLDRAEQDAILGQLGHVTDEEIQFLRQEFEKPLDVREFAWSVPLGLEDQVYGFSLMAIGLDRREEAIYLRDLAHGLRLDPERCNRIRDQLRQPG